MNYRQRVFDVMKPGVLMTPQEVNVLAGGIGVESVRAVLKWLHSTGRATQRRQGRQFAYALMPGAERPIDGRSSEARRAHVTATA